MSPREERLESLARTHGPRVLAYLARRIEPRADAADLLSEVLIVAWRRLDEVPSEDSEALPWLLGVARRLLSNQRRVLRRRTALVEELRGHVAAVVPGPGPDPVDLHGALKGLDSADREIITLTAWEGLTAAQAALTLGIEPAAARKRLQRARARLRIALDGVADPAI